jgi:hypothetical protein
MRLDSALAYILVPMIVGPLSEMQPQSSSDRSVVAVADSSWSNLLMR